MIKKILIGVTIACLVAFGFLTLLLTLPKKEIPPSVSTTDTRRYELIEIDSCEYILFSKFRKFGLSHKGNCKNHE